MAASFTPEDYFEAGMDLLAEVGPGAITVVALCQRLQVTKGSFYHHFGGIPDFMQRLLAYWEVQEIHMLAEFQAEAERGRPTEIAKLGAAWRIRHEAETAIRALGRTEPGVSAVQQRVDDRREDHLYRLFVGLGMVDGRARVLARLGMSVLIGTQQREHPVDRSRLEETLGEYQRWVEQAAGVAEPEFP